MNRARRKSRLTFSCLKKNSVERVSDGTSIVARRCPEPRSAAAIGRAAGTGPGTRARRPSRARTGRPQRGCRCRGAARSQRPRRRRSGRSRRAARGARHDPVAEHEREPERHEVPSDHAVASPLCTAHTGATGGERHVGPMIPLGQADGAGILPRMDEDFTTRPRPAPAPVRLGPGHRLGRADLRVLRSAGPDFRAGCRAGLCRSQAGHMAVFGILALLIWRALVVTTALRRPWAWALVLTILYAISDELHQGMVAGRHASASDVVIDAIGATMPSRLCGWSGRDGRPEPE